MFVLDSILLSPAKAFMWIVRELHNAAQQEIEGESERLTHRLSTLYMMLETGQLTQDEFEKQEREILERLDELESQAADDESLDEEADDSDDASADSDDDGTDDVTTDDASENAADDSP